MKFLRTGRYGRITGVVAEKPQRVHLTQVYDGCDCVDTQDRATGSGHRFPNHCAAHGNPWFMVRTDPVEDE